MTSIWGGTFCLRWMRHTLTANPLLSPYMTKVVKMWRGVGAWLWLATQNLKDYPDVAEKMLNMAEWWVCLTMPPEEVNNIARFKALTEEQKAVLLSAGKLSGCYTEGVVLAKKVEALFRVVPPSIYPRAGDDGEGGEGGAPGVNESASVQRTGSRISCGPEAGQAAWAD